MNRQKELKLVKKVEGGLNVEDFLVLGFLFVFTILNGIALYQIVDYREIMSGTIVGFCLIATTLLGLTISLMAIGSYFENRKVVYVEVNE